MADVVAVRVPERSVRSEARAVRVRGEQVEEPSEHLGVRGGEKLKFDVDRHERRPLPLTQRNAVPVGKRRHAASEMLGHGLLVARQQAERELIGTPEQLVHGGLAGNAHRDEGRLQGKRDHRSDGEPEPLLRNGARHDRHQLDAL